MTQIYLVRNCAYNGAGNLSARGRAETEQRGLQIRELLGGIESAIILPDEGHRGRGRSIRQSAELLAAIFRPTNARIEYHPTITYHPADDLRTSTPKIIVAQNRDLELQLAEIQTVLSRRIELARNELYAQHWARIEL